MSGQFWVLLPPICFVATGSGHISFCNVCGMGWEWWWDISCLTTSPCPALGKASHIPPWAAHCLCVCLSRPQSPWAAEPAWCPGVPLQQYPSPSAPLWSLLDCPQRLPSWDKVMDRPSFKYRVGSLTSDKLLNLSGPQFPYM